MRHIISLTIFIFAISVFAQQAPVAPAGTLPQGAPIPGTGSPLPNSMINQTVPLTNQTVPMNNQTVPMTNTQTQPQAVPNSNSIITPNTGSPYAVPVGRSASGVYYNATTTPTTTPQ